MRIPKEAWPVVEEIRRLVPRPEELPTPQGTESFGDGRRHLRWVYENALGTVHHDCPMDLLPYDYGACPDEVADFNFVCPFSIKQAQEFWEWWDVQEDPEEAVAEVWEKALSE